jgi:hypothetical protein
MELLRFGNICGGDDVECSDVDTESMLRHQGIKTRQLYSSIRVNRIWSAFVLSALSFEKQASNIVTCVIV